MRAAPAFAAALLLAGASPAAAQTAEADLKEFGLLGTWALDCAAPASGDNIFSRYEVRDGQVVNVHDAGSKFAQGVYVVRAAKPAGADLLSTDTIGPTGKQTTITLRRVGDRMQVWKVLGADGFSPVNDGKYIVNDAPIPVLSRCK